MKKSILFLLVMMAVNPNIKAQQESQLGNTSFITSLKTVSVNSVPYVGLANDKDYDYYMKKSKGYRAVGWSTLTGGLVLSGVGLLISASSSASFEAVETGVIIMGIGALSGIVSIPFMIMATVNKHKAQLMLDKKKTGFGVPSNVDKNIMGITMSIELGK